MEVCISKSVVGAEKHLIVSGDTFSWSDKIPDDYWVLGDMSPVRSLDVVSRAIGADIQSNPGEKWIKMWKQISSGDDYPRWSKMLPDETYKEYISCLIETSRMLLDSIDDTYFSREFLIGRELILSLVGACINEIRFHNILSTIDENHHGSISAFKPDDKGIAKVPVYDQSGSATGRLTIKEGPNILTLKKVYRDILTSRYRSGQILNVDFVSLEPRILYGINKGDPPVDIYDTISKELFDGDVHRSVIKTATIGSIYGMSNKKFSDVIGETDIVKASEILNCVKSFFGVNKMSFDLAIENKQTGSISNFFGRPLFPGEASKHILLNHFIQSTGVDVALIGFNKIINRLKDEGLEFCPVFLIHDGMLLDAHPDSVKKIKSIVKDGVKINGMNFLFPLNVSRL